MCVCAPRGLLNVAITTSSPIITCNSIISFPGRAWEREKNEIADSTDLAGLRVRTALTSLPVSSCSRRSHRAELGLLQLMSCQNVTRLFETLGADASVAAGPLGRQASAGTD